MDQPEESCRGLQRKSCRYAKKRNPFNHPCMMFRREAVLHAGNYQDFPGFEDYYLWVRMLRKGCKGYNVQEVILDMRTGNGMYDRRGGKGLSPLGAALSEISLL